MFIFFKYIPLLGLDSGFSLTHMTLNCFLYCMSRQLQVLYTTSLRHIEGRFCDILSYVMWLFYLRYKVSEICLIILIAIVLRSHLLRCAAEVNEPIRKYIAAFKFAFSPETFPLVFGLGNYKKLCCVVFQNLPLTGAQKSSYSENSWKL